MVRRLRGGLRGGLDRLRGLLGDLRGGLGGLLGDLGGGLAAFRARLGGCRCRSSRRSRRRRRAPEAAGAAPDRAVFRVPGGGGRGAVLCGIGHGAISSMLCPQGAKSVPSPDLQRKRLGKQNQCNAKIL